MRDTGHAQPYNPRRAYGTLLYGSGRKGMYTAPGKLIDGVRTNIAFAGDGEDDHAPERYDGSTSRRCCYV